MAYVRLKGRKWYICYRDASDALHETPTTATSKTEAKRLAGELERKIERQRLGLDPLPSDSTTTFWQLCSWWVENRCGARSRDDERYRLQKHVRDASLGALLLGKVTGSALEDRFREMETGGAEPGSVNKLRTILGTVIRRATREDPPLWTGLNPVERTDPRKSRKRVYQVLAPEEVELVLAHASKNWRGEIAVGVYLALRKGEVFGLRREDVDMRARLLTVRRSFDEPTTKTDEEATIPIPPPVVPYLEAALARMDDRARKAELAGEGIGSPGMNLLFPGRDGRMRTQEADPEKALRRVLGRAGLVLGYDHVCRRCKGREAPAYTWRHADARERRCQTCGMRLWPVPVPRPMRFHDLRHTTATILLRKRVEPHLVQKILRHANIRTTVDLYGHMVAEDARAAVDAAWDLPGSCQPPPTPGKPRAGGPGFP